MGLSCSVVAGGVCGRIGDRVGEEKKDKFDGKEGPLKMLKSDNEQNRGWA